MTILTFNLSILAGTALIVAGVAMLAGAGWACVAAGGLVLALTFVSAFFMGRP